MNERLKKKLHQTIKNQGLKSALGETIDSGDENNLKSALFGQKTYIKENIALAGLTFGDFVYDIASVNPLAIQAADFSRAEDLDNVFEFGFFADRLSDMNEAAADGAFSSLKGYVAEQYVASKLLEQGNQISFPNNPNEAGFDIVVDGQEFQIKCLSSLNGIEHHFDNYPETPVFANAELAQSITDSGEDWADLVFFVEGFDLETISEITSSSLEAGAEILDYEIPLFAAVISSVRNVHDWWRSDVSIVDAIANIAADVTVKGSLGVLGGFAGKGVGVLIFGPAGGVIFGGVIAVMAATQSRNLISIIKNTRASNKVGVKLIEASNGLLESISNGLASKMAIIRSKKQVLKGQQELVSYLIERFDDDIMYFQERLNEINSFKENNPKNSVKYAIGAIDIARRSKVHQYLLQKEYRDVLDAFSSLQKSSKSWFR